MRTRAAQTFFDGKSIHVPPEMKNAMPGKVTVYFSPSSDDDTLPEIKSLRDLVGKYSNPKSAAELDAILEEERNSWGDE